VTEAIAVIRNARIALVILIGGLERRECYEHAGRDRDMLLPFEIRVNTPTELRR